MDLAAYLRDTFADVELEESDLHGYQEELVGLADRVKRLLVLVDMGLGKTGSILTLLARLRLRGELGRALIVAPIRVARKTWPDEIRKWRHTAWMPFSIIRGEDDDEEVVEAKSRAYRVARKQGLDVKEARSVADKVARTVKQEIAIAALREDVPIHIINRERLAWLAGTKKKPGILRELGVKQWPYDVIVIDESTSFADHGSERFKAAKTVAHYANRLYELTATPVADGYMKLFAQVYLIDRGERLGVNITAFREEYFRQNPYTKKWKLLPGAAETISKKIADISVVMEAKDHLDLDEPTIIPRIVKLSKAERQRYDELETSSVLRIDDEKVIEAATASALRTKLLQLSSGAVYDAEGGTHLIHHRKVEELEQIVEETQGEPILVGYWFKSSLVRLKKSFPQAVVMDRAGKAVETWNRGKIPMLLAHPQGAAHGLNMQDGGSIVSFFDIPDSYELWIQFIRRLARQGQRNPVRVFPIITARTWDVGQVESLKQKQDGQEEFYRYVKSVRFRDRKLTSGSAISGF